MRFGVRTCDLGLSGGRFGACAVDTGAEVVERPGLSIQQRSARAIAGVGFLGLAALVKRSALSSSPVATALGWFGATHLLAVATAFNGCPELGVVPTLLLRRDVATECGPWEWVDTRLHLGPWREARGSPAPSARAADDRLQPDRLGSCRLLDEPIEEQSRVS